MKSPKIINELKFRVVTFDMVTGETVQIFETHSLKKARDFAFEAAFVKRECVRFEDIGE